MLRPTDLPEPVVRLAGMPVSVLAVLRFPRTSTMVAAVVEQEERLAQDATVLADELHDLIGSGADPALRPPLVGLRRAVHNRRRPHRREWNDDIERAVGPALTRRINDWLDACSRWREQRDGLPATLAAETATKQSGLRELVADPAFRRGLSHSSIPLLAELHKWLDEPASPPRRAVLFRLAKYVARAATKTSPYSTFTVMGAGRWGAGPQPVRLLASGTPHGVLDLSDLWRSAIVGGLQRLPDLRDSLLVRVNPSALPAGGKLTFLGSAPGEPLVTVPVTPTLRHCLELVGAATPATLGEVRDRLARGEDRAAADRYLAHLGDMGLLELRPPAGGEPYALEELAGWVGGNGYGALAGVLRQVDADLRAPVPVTDIAAHLAREDSLRAAVRRLLGMIAAETGTGTEPEPPSANLPAGAGSGSGGGRAAATATDTVVATAVLAECGAAAWQPVLRDLDAVRRWFGIFDLRLPLRVALGDWWAEHLPAGARLPFLRLHRLLQDEVAAGSAVGTEVRRLMSMEGGTLPLPGSRGRLAEVARLRAEAVRPFQAGRSGGGPVRVGAGELVGLADGWPAWVVAPASMGCYVQPVAADGGRWEVVLNSVHIGYGKGRSRVARLVERAGGPGPGPGPGGGPPVPAWSRQVLAEPGGCFGFALNDRVPGAPFEIDYPFTASARPAVERLPLNDLLVSYDSGRGMVRLVSQRLDREVRVAQLGMLAHALLPPALRLLVGLSCPEPPWMPAWLFHRGSGDPPPPGEVHPAPRLGTGRVTLCRAGWVTAAASVPVRGGGEPDAAYLLRLARWRRRHGIPERCFVRLSPRLPSGRLGGEGWRQLVRARKPLYVEFDSWFLVLAMENMLRTADGLVIFEETLPDPAADPAGGRVCELLVEANATGGA